MGHSFDKPIASRQAGTLRIVDTPEAVLFEASLPDDPPTWVVDAEKAIAGGLMTGVSPRFRVPPAAVVPNAQSLIPEPGNPGVQIRRINEAVLRELSVVTDAVYEGSGVQLRSEDGAANAALLLPKVGTLWL